MRLRPSVAILLAALATLAALWLDPIVYHHLPTVDLERRDWGRALRVMGTLYVWAPLALAFWLEARSRDPARARSAWLVAIAPAAAGLLAELLKLLIRRERPNLHDGEYAYRSFMERPFDSHDLGFPSSHATVAFGGAAIIAWQFPRAGWIAYLLAAGCAITRVVAQAHFLSDVIGGALVGWAVATILGRRFPQGKRAD
jgi:membrane-associated phospholipid phosphatase